MIWSKLKQTFESRLAPALRGRLQVHVTAYRGRFDLGRGWIMFDGEEIVSVQAPGFTMSISGHQTCLDMIGGSFTESGLHVGAQTTELGAACGELIQSPIVDALGSPNPLVRGLAVLDRRCGKATYRALAAHETHLFVRLMLGLRMTAEGHPVSPIECPNCQAQLFPPLHGESLPARTSRLPRKNLILQEHA